MLDALYKSETFDYQLFVIMQKINNDVVKFCRFCSLFRHATG